ncbi:MAG: phage holin family protein [Oscillospiraceae bacterium]|nr:phage holin family protein [Oscillospiraceae bacterium]
MLFAQSLKVFTPLSSKHLPVICGIFGLIQGIVCFYFFPDFIQTDNLLTAATKGIVSGWAATGANQIVKQYSSE